MKHPVGSIEEFSSGSISVRTVGARSIGIVNTGSKLYAVLNVCPHALAPICEGKVTGTMLPSQPGEVLYGLENRMLRCPWHGFEFDLENGGRSAFTSFKARVRMFPVTLEAGVVFVEVRERREDESIVRRRGPQ